MDDERLNTEEGLNLYAHTGVGQMNVCMAPHTGSVGSPLVGSASVSITHACVQYSVSALNPVTATGASVPLPVGLVMVWLAVAIWLEL
jgi:hypothetical protein